MSGRGETDRIGNLLAQTFSQLETDIRQSKARGESVEHVGHLVFSRYRPIGPLIDSESLIADRLRQISRSLGVAGARAAYGIYVKQITLSDVRDIEGFRGVLMLASDSFDRAQEVGERLKLERQNFRRAISTIENQAESDRKAAIASWSDESARIRSLTAKLIVRGRSNLRQQREYISNQSLEAIENIRETERAFIEQMRLQAPVEYWRNKAKSHQENKDVMKKWLTLFFPTSAFLIILMYSILSIFLVLSEKGGSKIPSSAYFIMSAGLVSVSAIIFWVGRLLTKIYISENHLRYDAEERATMTTTYLALTRESAANDLDRQIILSALFRSGSDGLVKDDGSAEVLSPAALIARLGGTKS